MSIDQVLDLQDQQEDCVADWADGGRQGAEQDQGYKVGQPAAHPPHSM